MHFILHFVRSVGEVMYNKQYYIVNSWLYKHHMATLQAHAMYTSHTYKLRSRTSYGTRIARQKCHADIEQKESLKEKLLFSQ